MVYKRRKKNLKENWRYKSTAELPQVKPDNAIYLPVSVVAQEIGLTPMAIRLRMNEMRAYKPKSAPAMVCLDDVKRIFNVYEIEE